MVKLLLKYKANLDIKDEKEDEEEDYEEEKEEQ